MNTTITLFEDPMSSQCYSVKLFLALQGIDYQSNVSKIDPLLPKDAIPEMHIATDIVYGVQPCLVYLQQMIGPVEDQLDQDTLQYWQHIHQQLMQSLGYLRQENLANQGLIDNEALLLAKSRQVLQALEDHFCRQTVMQQQWLCATPQYSILDLQLFPLIALSMDVGIVLDDYVHLRRWLNRIRRLPGFIPMAGLLEF